MNNLVVRNSAGSNTVAEYLIVGGNKVGPIKIDFDLNTATPWANFDL